MGISFRIYLFLDDGSMKRVPRRIVEALPFGDDAIPEYAGTRQRIAQVLIDNEGGRPSRILDATGHYWDFDAEGRIDESLRETSRDWIDVAFASPKLAKGKIVDLVPAIKKKEMRDRHRWTLTNDDIDLIAADIWPGIRGPAPEVSSVTGKAPKKPPLSYDAKHALEEIGNKLDVMKFELTRLSEHSLKGLEFEALRSATFEDPELWRAVAAQAARQRAIHAAYRTGKGEWIAVVEAIRSKDAITEASVATAHVRCTSRAAAIEAGKRLMAEKADWLGPSVRIEVSIISALEWIEND